LQAFAKGELGLDNEVELKAMIDEEIALLEKQLETLSKQLIYAIVQETEFDLFNKCQMEFSPGVGGTEATLFTFELLEMYKKFVGNKGWTWNLLQGNLEEGRALIGITGEKCYQALRNEAGIHRVQRTPVTDKSRVHTSTSSVVVLPEPEQVEAYIKPGDYKLETMRASGPGGQNVNKRSSAVRLTHLSTGLSVKVMDERFQHLNMKIAFQRLSAILLQYKIDEMEEKVSQSRKIQVGSKARAEKIRTYNFKDDRITDHRLRRSWTGMTDMLKDAQLLNVIINAIEEEKNVERLTESTELILKKYNLLNNNYLSLESN
uniref:RF_PROK_I domain-containing protein n=1 Tax=Dracunculus medinensis TaxID=318479 RepID=A0A0N4U6W7_DRAME